MWIVHFTYKFNYIYICWFKTVYHKVFRRVFLVKVHLILPYVGRSGSYHFSFICRTSLRWFRELPTLTPWDSFRKPNLTHIPFGSFNTINSISFKYKTSLSCLSLLSYIFIFFKSTCNLPPSRLVLSFHLLALCVASQSVFSQIEAGLRIILSPHVPARVRTISTPTFICFCQKYIV